MFIEKINACSICSPGGGLAGGAVGVWRPVLTSPPRAAGLSQPHLPRAKTSLSSPKLPEEMTLVGSEISVGWDAENLEALLKLSQRLGKGMGNSCCLPLSLPGLHHARGVRWWRMGSTHQHGWGWHHQHLVTPNPPIPRLPAAKRKNNFQKAKTWAKVAAGIHRAIPS